MFPEAGGSSSFARHAFNEFVSFFAGWALSLDYILTIAISAFFVPHYLSAFWPALKHPPGDVIGGLAVVGLLAWLNIRGIGESAKVNFVLAVADLLHADLDHRDRRILCAQPVVAGPSGPPRDGADVLAPDLRAIAGDARLHGDRDRLEHGRGGPRPRARRAQSGQLILVAVLGVYAGITVVALSALPVQGHGRNAYTLLGLSTDQGGYQNDPVLGIIQHLGLGVTVRHILGYYVGILAATILVIATNAGLIGISRLSWSLAEHRQLPGVFARLHPKHRTPWFTIVFFSVIAGALLIPGKTTFLGNLYSFGAMLSFTTAHAAVIALRVKDPDRERPYRMPWNIRIRGRGIPLFAVIGGLGTFAAWISVIALHAEARTVGVGWMLFGLVGYVIYRRSQGLDLTSQHKIERRQRPPFFVELEYRSAIVPIFGTDVDASALRTAAKLVGEGAAVEAVYVLRVPNQLSLDAGLEQEEQVGLGVLESAKLAGRKAGVKVQTRLMRARNPGHALVEEARRRNAEIIYLGTAHAPPSERALGPTASYLLAHRPCRVVVEIPPADGSLPERAREPHTPERATGNGPDGRRPAAAPKSKLRRLARANFQKESERRERNADHAPQTSPTTYRYEAPDHDEGV